MDQIRDIEALTELGFTQLESEIYLTLLGMKPQTGYGIAKRIHKPTANVYKALTTLHQKGAVLMEADSGKHVRAVHPDELLKQLDRRFAENRQRVEDILRNAGRPKADDNLYQIQSVDQLYERCDRMLHSAEMAVLADIYPAPYQRLLPRFQELVDRGLTLCLHVYEPVTIKATFVAQARKERIISGWPRQWLRMTVDGKQGIIALLTEDGQGIHQAFWSESPVVAYSEQYSLGSDILLTLLQRELDNGNLDELEKIHSRWTSHFSSRSAPGKQYFESFFGWKNREDHDSELRS